MFWSWPQGSNCCLQYHLYELLFIPQLASICRIVVGQSILRSLSKSSPKDKLSIDMDSKNILQLARPLVQSQYLDKHAAVWQMCLKYLQIRHAHYVETDKERHHFWGNWVVVKPQGLPGCSENAGAETCCETPTWAPSMNNLTASQRTAVLLRRPNEACCNKLDETTQAQVHAACGSNFYLFEIFWGESRRTQISFIIRMQWIYVDNGQIIGRL